MKKFILSILLIFPLSSFSQLDTVLVGARAHDPQADNIREAFIKVNKAIIHLDTLDDVVFDSIQILIDQTYDSIASVQNSLWVEINNLQSTISSMVNYNDSLKDRITSLEDQVTVINNYLELILANLEFPLDSPTEAEHILYCDKIIWKWDSVFQATGYLFNDSNLVASALDIGNNLYYEETGLEEDSNYVRYIWAYNNSDTSLYTPLSGTTVICFTCGGSLTINHIADTVAPVTKTVTYGTINNVPGETTKCWITSNLGADHQAIAKDDATEASAGWYWQFNRAQGFKHDGTTRTPNTTWITSVYEYSTWITNNDPCYLELGSGWRVPTITEWSNVDAGGNWVNWTGPWNSLLKMHAAGRLDYYFGTLSDRGSKGLYWSSSQTGTLDVAQCLYFFAGNSSTSSYQKSYGHTLRCVHN